MFPSVLTIETPRSRRPVGKRAAACSRPWGPGEVTLGEEPVCSQGPGWGGRTRPSSLAEAVKFLRSYRVPP